MIANNNKSMLAMALQTLLVTLLVGLAAVYLAYALYRSTRKGGACCSTGCGAVQKHGPEENAAADQGNPAGTTQHFLPVEDLEHLAKRHSRQRQQ